MSELVIKGDGSFAYIPVCDAGDPPDYNLVQLIPIPVEFGTQAEPKRIWSNGSCSLECYSYVDTGGYVHYTMKWSPLPGWTAPPSPPYYTEIGNVSEMYIGCYKTGTNAYVGWCLSENTFPYSNGTMFNGTYANLEQSITEIPDWDESPADDTNNPDNMLARGGEFADTDPLGFGNDEIDVPDVINELSYSGFITAYKLDDGGIQNLGAAIFTTNTWTNLQNKFNGVGDPVSYIISAVEIPYSANPDGAQDFNLGGIKVVDNNNNYLSVPCLNHRYHMLNFGSLTLKETWGTEKDYSGTSVSIYLPYVGVKDLDTALVMNSVITVKAMLDVWTGDLLYMLVISNKNAAYKYLGSSGIVYRFQGNCGKSIPIGKTDNTTQMLAIAGSIASMGVGLASGLPTGAMGYTVGNEFGASGDVSGNVNPRLVGGGAAGMIGALTMGPKISMAGGVAGAIGRGDYQQPYLIIKQSVPVYPKDWRAHFGAPRYQTFTLNTLTGYVKCADVHAESIEGANDAERAAIEQALKAGVFMS